MGTSTGQISKSEFKGLRIRDATFADAHAVAALIEQLGYPCSPEDAAERIDRVAEDPDQIIRLAEQDGFIAGLVSLHFLYYLPLGRTTCRITSLVVHERMRKSGIGNALLRHIELKARRAGAARIELTSAESREHAHAFYRRHGFEQTGIRFLKRLGDA